MSSRLALGSLTFVLAACAASPQPSTSTSTSTSSSSPRTTVLPATTTSASDAAADRYLDALGDLLAGAGFVETLDDARELYVAVGERMCRLLDIGLVVDDLLTVALVTAGALEEDGESFALGGLVLGAAVAELCPRHLDELDASG